MFSIWYSVVYIFIVATVISFLEIQIEGEHGWAKNLPCWRANPKWKITKFYSWFQGGKEVTGYHLALNTLELIIFHSPFFAGVSWNLLRELQILSCMPLFWLFQDFTWFVWNPFYGLKKFNRHSIKWHQKWIGSIPTDYLTGIAFSGIFVLLAVLLKNPGIIEWWLKTIILLMSLIIVSCVIQLIRKKNRL